MLLTCFWFLFRFFFKFSFNLRTVQFLGRKAHKCLQFHIPDYVLQKLLSISCHTSFRLFEGKMVSELLYTGHFWTSAAGIIFNTPSSSFECVKLNLTRCMNESPSPNVTTLAFMNFSSTFSTYCFPLIFKTSLCCNFCR